MLKTRGVIRRMNIPDAMSNETVNSINAIRTVTYDPNLRQLLTDLEYERAGIEARIILNEQANDLYQTTVARMDLRQNRKTHRELADLAEVERMGWTNDKRRHFVDIACSEQAAIGFAIDMPRGDNGPQSCGPTVASMFKEPGWTTAKTCYEDCTCQDCEPVSPGAKAIDSTGASGRWAIRVAERARTA